MCTETTVPVLVGLKFQCTSMGWLIIFYLQDQDQPYLEKCCWSLDVAKMSQAQVPASAGGLS